MPDNCYWTNEIGCFESCTEETLPPLTAGWVQFDTEPDGTGGRSYYADSSGDSRHPTTAAPAYGNGVIVMACSFHYGVQPIGDPGSHRTYGVFVSDDDGFTYSNLVEPVAWLAGAGVYYSGHDANYQYDDTHEHPGTKISFDGTNFYIVTTTHYDESETALRIRTLKSSDGVTWSEELTAQRQHTVTGSDSYNGNVWYVGTNDPAASYAPFDTEVFVACHSSDDGATWSTYNYVTGTGDMSYGTVPYDINTDTSANVDGLHIVEELYYGGAAFGINYFRPTSNTTWAAPVLLFDYDPGEYNEDTGPKILASRITAGLVLCTQGRDIYGADKALMIRKSTDSGATWGAETVAMLLDVVTLERNWAWFYARSAQEIVELDDGRIVVVAVFEGYDTGLADYVPMVAYAVSNDFGSNFDPPVVFSIDEWIYDDNFNAMRINACAKGNDVIVTANARQTAGQNFIFRP